MPRQVSLGFSGERWALRIRAKLNPLVMGLVALMSLAIEANASISAIFMAIDRRISEVPSSMDGLYSGIGEIRTGSKEILEAMAELSRISGEVNANIGEITAGISGIHASIAQVAEFAESVGAESAMLDAEVNRFIAAESAPRIAAEVRSV